MLFCFFLNHYWGIVIYNAMKLQCFLNISTLHPPPEHPLPSTKIPKVPSHLLHNLPPTHGENVLKQRRFSWNSTYKYVWCYFFSMAEKNNSTTHGGKDLACRSPELRFPYNRIPKHHQFSLDKDGYHNTDFEVISISAAPRKLFEIQIHRSFKFNRSEILGKN